MFKHTDRTRKIQRNGKKSSRSALLPFLALLILALLAGCARDAGTGGVAADTRGAGPVAGGAGPDTTGASAEIRAVLAAQVAAWNAGDLEGYMQGYWKNDSVRFVSGNGVSHGWSAMLERYRRGYPDKARMGRLRFEDVEVSVHSAGSASVFGKWLLERAGDAPWGYFTLLMKRTDAGWRVVLDHTSSAK